MSLSPSFPSFTSHYFLMQFFAEADMQDKWIMILTVRHGWHRQIGCINVKQTNNLTEELSSWLNGELFNPFVRFINSNHVRDDLRLLHNLFIPSNPLPPFSYFFSHNRPPVFFSLYTHTQTHINPTLSPQPRMDHAQQDYLSHLYI